MDLASREVTTWTMPTDNANLLAFDSLGQVWSLDEGANVDRFNPNTNQLCTLPLPGGAPGSGIYLTAHGDEIWLGDRANGAIGRITATLTVSPAYTLWPIPIGTLNSDPHGLVIAPNGEVWWADKGLGKIGRLDPSTDRITLYGPAALDNTPEQVAYRGGKVWFTAPFSLTLGVIDPATAVGSGPLVVTPTVSTLSPICADAGAGTTFIAGISNGVASFTPVVFTTTLDVDSTLYTAPDDGTPFGLTFVGFDLWSTDTYRDKLVRIDTATSHLFVPFIRR
jgi:streptogramin lyase